jgi:hypothetical protein
MELAIINGTYRDGSKIQQKMNQILIPNNGASGGLAQTVIALKKIKFFKLNIIKIKKHLINYIN